jgi:hypothetical protein
MKKARKNRVLIKVAALFVLFLPCVLGAQGLPNYELQLSLSSYEAGYSMERDIEAYPRGQGLYFSNPVSDGSMLAGSLFEAGELEEQESMELDEVLSVSNPSITITNSYQSRTAAYGNAPDSSFAITSDKGRWQIHGSFEQKYFTQIDDKAYQDRSSGLGFYRGSARVSDEGGEELKTSVSSSYYLEAVYSFKPTVKGRVALKHSQIDTFDTEKTIQFEGIVEPKPNVQIKAGFDNELGAESNVDSKGAKARVWTEFILKF